MKLSQILIFALVDAKRTPGYNLISDNLYKKLTFIK